MTYKTKHKPILTMLDEKNKPVWVFFIKQEGHPSFVMYVSIIDIKFEARIANVKLEQIEEMKEYGERNIENYFGLEFRPFTRTLETKREIESLLDALCDPEAGGKIVATFRSFVPPKVTII